MPPGAIAAQLHIWAAALFFIWITLGNIGNTDYVGDVANNMRWFRSLKRKRDIKEQLDELLPPQKRRAMSGCYQKDVAYLKRAFQDDDPIEIREMNTGATVFSFSALCGG